MRRTTALPSSSCCPTARRGRSTTSAAGSWGTPKSRTVAFSLALAGVAVAAPSRTGQQELVTSTTFVIRGHGYGHGVGMGQWGAYGAAKAGLTYDRILAFYYPGTKLAQSPVKSVRVLLA